MAEPPQKPKPSADASGGLEEVERALSVLGGRHPEAVRAEREAAEAKARREAARIGEAAAERTRRRRTLVLAALGVVLLVALGGTALWLRARARTREAVVQAREAPFGRLGFTEVEALAGTSLQIEVDAPSCWVVLGALGDTTTTVTRGATPTPVPGGAAVFCTCGAESILATAPAELRTLRVPATDVGGVLALEHVLPSPHTSIGGSEACDVDHLAAWARTRAPRGAASTPPSEALAARGFTSAPGLAEPYPFVVIAPERDRCVLAEAVGGTLTLVGREGGGPPTPFFALCDAKGEGAILRRNGSGAVNVASVAGVRIGGAIGMREALVAAGRVDTPLVVRDDDRAALAEETLRASVVPEPKSAFGAPLLAQSAPDARVVLVSSKDGSMYLAEGPSGATFQCSPPLSVVADDRLCVETAPHSWHLPWPDAVGALAWGPLPYWMSAFHELPAGSRADALGPELALLTLARRLAARGFDPTIVEGVTERERGVDVLGRSGEDAVVVVGTWPAPPFVGTYGAPGEDPWPIDGEPRVVPLRGGERLALTTKNAPSAPLAARRTVVFRHAAK
jgi:hypothetical protein